MKKLAIIVVLLFSVVMAVGFGACSPGSAGHDSGSSAVSIAAATDSAAAADSRESAKAKTVTLSIDCMTILGNMDKLTEGKEGLVGDGWIMKAKKVALNDGETVFDVLVRECKAAKLHMEHSFVPMYESAYIEGINNLYEFDAGELSGWMYSVNDWYPNYGCSKYELEDGDVIKWRYTCDLGKDVGGEGAVAN